MDSSSATFAGLPMSTIPTCCPCFLCPPFLCHILFGMTWVLVISHNISIFFINLFSSFKIGMGPKTGSSFSIDTQRGKRSPYSDSNHQRWFLDHTWLSFFPLNISHVVTWVRLQHSAIMGVKWKRGYSAKKVTGHILIHSHHSADQHYFC